MQLQLCVLDGYTQIYNIRGPTKGAQRKRQKENSVNTRCFSDREVPNILILPYLKCYYLEINSYKPPSGGYCSIYVYIYMYVAKELQHFVLSQGQLLKREYIYPGCEIQLLPGINRQPFRFRKIRTQRSCLFFFYPLTYKSTSFLSPIKMVPVCFLHKRLVIAC